jgi:hypothetical protein
VALFDLLLTANKRPASVAADSGAGHPGHTGQGSAKDLRTINAAPTGNYAVKKNSPSPGSILDSASANAITSAISSSREKVISSAGAIAGSGAGGSIIVDTQRTSLININNKNNKTIDATAIAASSRNTNGLKAVSVTVGTDNHVTAKQQRFVSAKKKRKISIAKKRRKKPKLSS